MFTVYTTGRKFILRSIQNTFFLNKNYEFSLLHYLMYFLCIKYSEICQILNLIYELSAIKCSILFNNFVRKLAFINNLILNKNKNSRFLNSLF